MLLLAVVWAVYLSECFARWRPGDWVFRRSIDDETRGIDRPDVTFWNERFAFVWTSPWPADLSLRCAGTSFDVEACQARIDEVRHHSRGLRTAATALFVLLLVCFPFLVATERLLPWLPVFLGALIPAWAATLWMFRRTYRRVHGTPPPLEEQLAHALSPLTLVRGPRTVALQAAAGVHPVAAAGVLCTDDEFLRIARLCHYDSAADRAAIETVVESRGLTRAFQAPPAPDDPALCRYCPRCHAAYLQGATECADCQGTPLKESLLKGSLNPSLP
jgi:hypothetical protein